MYNKIGWGVKPGTKKLKQVDEVQREVSGSQEQPELRQEAGERIPSQVTGAQAAAAEQYWSLPWIVKTVLVAQLA